MRRAAPLRGVALTLVALIATDGLAGATAPSDAVRTASDAGSGGAPAADPLAPLPSFALPADADLSTDAARTTVDTPAAAGAIDLGAAVDKAFATATAMTAEDWSIADLEWRLDGDPLAAFAFVRDHIGFEPYDGMLRGAGGTLAARAGNATDRAVLLKRLLDDMLVTTRFAVADLDDATAERLLATTWTGAAQPLQDAGVADVAPLDPAAIATRASRDYARLRAALGSRLAQLPAAPADPSLGETRHHVWVQAALGTGWLDLDPSFPDAQPGVTLVAPTTTADQLPSAETQTVTLEVIASVASGGLLVADTVLSRTFSAAEAADDRLFVYFQPDVSGLGGQIISTLSGITSYQPELIVNHDVQPGSNFLVNSTGSDLFGEPSGSAAQLARLVIRVTRTSPTEGSQSADKVLLDRVPPELRDSPTLAANQLTPFRGDSGGIYALQQVHHVIISTGGADPYAHAVDRGTSAQFAQAGLVNPQTAGDFAFPDILVPYSVGTELMTLASDRAIVPHLSDRPDVRAVIARPRVFVTSFGPDPASPQAFATQTDLLLDDVRVVSAQPLDAATSARYQLWYGALESALEAEFNILSARNTNPATRRIVQTSLAMSGGFALSVVDAGTTPPAAPQALKDQLASGLIAVVPGTATAGGTWWNIGPGGATRAVLDPGLGGGGGSGYNPGNYANASGGGPRYVIDPNTGETLGVEQDGKLIRYTKPAPPAPKTCRGGQEYVAIVGCVSTQMAAVLRWGTAPAVLFVVCVVAYLIFG